MTYQKQIKVLDNAIELAYGRIEQTNATAMDTQEFRILLKNTRDMVWLQESVSQYLERAERPEQVNASGSRPPDRAEATTAEVEVTTTPGISKEELRDKLATYSNKYSGLDVAQIMSGMGYNKLSEIPADRYGELLGLVEASLKGET